MKILVAGLGWAMAELVLTRLIFLWVGGCAWHRVFPEIKLFLQGREQ